MDFKCEQEETRLLVLLLVAHCRDLPDSSIEPPVDILFELLTVFLKPLLADFTFLKVCSVCLFTRTRRYFQPSKTHNIPADFM
jgi:hypothetical protein